MFVDVCLALQKLCIEENRRNERKKSDFFSSFFLLEFSGTHTNEIVLMSVS